MLIKLKNKIESEVSKIGNIKLGEFGIHFSEQPPYIPEGISIVEDRNGRYNLVFTERGKINFSTKLNKIYYIDASDNEYNLSYLPNRIVQTFYVSIVKLKTIKEWMIQLNGDNGLVDEYEATLLGYSSEGIEKF